MTYDIYKLYPRFTPCRIVIIIVTMAIILLCGSIQTAAVLKQDAEEIKSTVDRSKRDEVNNPLKVTFSPVITKPVSPRYITTVPQPHHLLYRWIGTDEGECRYNGSSYSSGDFVKTGEPCLNCTCTRSYLICYLRVCPQIPIPPPQGCIILHKRDVCCPQLVCSEDNGIHAEELLSRHSRPHDGEDEDEEEEAAASDQTTSNDAESNGGKPEIIKQNVTTTALSTSKSCKINGTIYADGSAMLSSSQCEYCYCIKGKQNCVKPNCILQLAGCTPIFRKHTCCPIKYNCTALRNVTIISSSTSMTPSPLTTTTAKLPVTSLVATSTSASSTNTPMIITTTTSSIGYTNSDATVTSTITTVLTEEEITTNSINSQEDNSSPVSPQDYDAAPAAAVLEERQKPDQNHHDSAIDMDQTSSDIITSTITIATSPDISDSTTTGQALTTEEISDEPTETSQETTTASPPFITTDENYYWATAGTTINRMVDNFLSESIRDVTNIKTTVYQAIGNVAADTTAVSFADEMTNADIVITTAEEEEVVTQPTTTRRSSIAEEEFTEQNLLDQTSPVDIADNKEATTSSSSSSSSIKMKNDDDVAKVNDDHDSEQQKQDVEFGPDNMAMETTSRKLFGEEFSSTTADDRIENEVNEHQDSAQIVEEPHHPTPESSTEENNDTAPLSADKRSDARINNSTSFSADFSANANLPVLRERSTTSAGSSSTNIVISDDTISTTTTTNAAKTLSSSLLNTVPAATEMEAIILNTTKTKQHPSDYELDYDEPTLPPSLPNLKIIPFVAADALDHPQDDSSSSVEQSEEVDPLPPTLDVSGLPQINQFSPPIETEGGFVPKEPTLDGPYFESKYVSMHQQPTAVDEGGLSGIQQQQQHHHVYPPLITTVTKTPYLVVKKKDVCVTVDHATYKHGELISEPKACNMCVCLHGKIVCQEPDCPPINDGCQRLKNVDVENESCCGEIICDDYVVPEKQSIKKQPIITTVGGSSDKVKETNIVPILENDNRRKPSVTTIDNAPSPVVTLHTDVPPALTSHSDAVISNKPAAGNTVGDLQFQIPTSWFPSDEKYLSQLEKIPAISKPVESYNDSTTTTTTTTTTTQTFASKTEEPSLSWTKPTTNLYLHFSTNDTITTVSPNVWPPPPLEASTFDYDNQSDEENSMEDNFEVNSRNNSSSSSSTTTTNDYAESSSSVEESSENDYDNGISLDNVLSFLFDEPPTSSTNIKNENNNINSSFKPQQQQQPSSSLVKPSSSLVKPSSSLVKPSSSLVKPSSPPLFSPPTRTTYNASSMSPTSIERYDDTDDPMMEMANSVSLSTQSINNSTKATQQPQIAYQPPDNKSSPDSTREGDENDTNFFVTTAELPTAVEVRRETLLLHNPLVLDKVNTLSKLPPNVIRKKPIVNASHRPLIRYSTTESDFNFPSPQQQPSTRPNDINKTNKPIFVTVATTTNYGRPLVELFNSDTKENSVKTTVSSNSSSSSSSDNQIINQNETIVDAISAVDENNGLRQQIDDTMIVDHRKDVLPPTTSKKVVPTTTMTTTTTSKVVIKSPLIPAADPGAASGLLKLSACNIFGKMYKTGKLILELSGPCLQCMCTDLGVQCSPLQC